MTMTGATGWRGRFDQVMDFTLWADGGLFADERDRLRVLESTWIAACLQQLLIPWALLVGALVGPDVVVPYLAVIGLLYALSWLVSWVYLARHRVPTQPRRYGAKFIISAVLVNLPTVVLLGLWIDLAAEEILAFLLIVVLVVWAEMRVRRWSDRAADTDDEEEEPGGVAQHPVLAWLRRYRWWIPIAAVPVLALSGFVTGWLRASAEAGELLLGVLEMTALITALVVGALIAATAVRQRRRRTMNTPATGEESGRW